MSILTSADAACDESASSGSSSTAMQWHHTVASDGETAVAHFATCSGLSKQVIKMAMSRGAAWQSKGSKTERIRRAKKVIAAGTELHLYYDPKILESSVAAAELHSDEKRYSIWHKPYGMLSQGSKWGDHCTLYRFVEGFFSPPRACYMVHRLDRAASGLIMLAHDKSSAAQLADLFQQRQVEKVYRVCVEGQFPDQEQSFTQALDGKEAISHARLLSYDAQQATSTIEVQIDTGRKHQIRRHLAAANFPVVGDRLYGNGHASLDLQLTAYRLAFTCPLSGWKKNYQLDS